MNDSHSKVVRLTIGSEESQAKNSASRQSLDVKKLLDSKEDRYKFVKSSGRVGGLPSTSYKRMTPNKTSQNRRLSEDCISIDHAPNYLRTIGTGSSNDFPQINEE